MQTKNLKKKGFTLVELVVVVAVIAVLSAILIPTIGCFVEQAKETNDMATVRLLNTALVEDEAANGKSATMTDALAAMAKKGYLVDKLTPRSTGEILWDSLNNRFLLRNKDGDDVYRDNTSKPAEGVALWKVVGLDETLSKTYSNYLKEGYEIAGSALEITTGLDVGENSHIKTIKYLNNTTTVQNVQIYMNGGSLEIDAERDSIDFYGIADDILIKKIANESFHVFGLITNTLEVKQGHIVLENNSLVSKLVSESVVTIDAKEHAILIDNTEIKNETAKTNTASAVQNAENKPYLNIENVDDFMSALGYTKAGEKNYYSNKTESFNSLIRLKAGVQIDISKITIDNNTLNVDKGVVVIANSSIDLNGGCITTANFALIVRKDNVTIYNGTLQAGTNDNKATGINSYVLGIEANNFTLRNMVCNGGVSAGFDISAKNVLIENCNIKAADWYAVCAQAGSSVKIKGGTYSRSAVTEGKTPSVSFIFQADGKVGDFGKAGDVNRIDFENVTSKIEMPFASGVTTATINNKICNGYISGKIGG